jgi:hypothetical protein
MHVLAGVGEARSFATVNQLCHSGTLFLGGSHRPETDRFMA